jgi:hypothetical protein
LSSAASSEDGDGHSLWKVLYVQINIALFMSVCFVFILCAEYDAATEQAGTVESQVQNLHKQIMTITSGRMKAAQNKVDDISKNLDKVRQEVTRLKVGIRTSERFV